MAQPNLEKETDLENLELIPTPEKAEELIRVEGMDEEVATNSPMTLTPRGKIRSELNEQDGEDPLARHIRLSETSQSSDEFDLVHRKVKNSDNTQYSIYKNKIYSKTMAAPEGAHHCGGNVDSIFQGLRYDGTTEPTNHLAIFKNILKLKNIKDEEQIMTRFFITLRGPAVAWYQCAT
eukprot:Gb_23655 [translate_table: standard]